MYEYVICQIDNEQHGSTITALNFCDQMLLQLTYYLICAKNNVALSILQRHETNVITHVSKSRPIIDAALVTCHT